ncbi:pyocin knob domain-containing protein [Acinetobacter lwoffii]|uniref:pyocin knob domain-containing protein n=1 Tax=Acinetobacter lwoffii TaxID=28090 RepID=UPI003F907273
MADQPVTREKLINADKDVDSLGEAANEVKVVNPRYGNPYYSGPLAVQHIMDMGGWDSFPTQAELQASTPTTSAKVAIALDTGFLWRFSGGAWANTNKKPFQEIYDYVNANGLFKPIQFTSTVWTHADQLKTSGWHRVPSTTVATSMGLPNPQAGFLLVVSNSELDGNFVKQEWFPQASSKMFFRTSDVNGVQPAWGEVITNANKEANFLDYAKKSDVFALSKKSYDVKKTSMKNLFDASKIQDGKYLNNSGVVTPASGWGMSAYIPVTAGQQYTLSGTRGRQGLSFFANNTDTTPISYNSSSVLPLTVTAPVGANFAVFNLYSSTVPTYSKVQFELGASATSYELGGEQYYIDPSFILSDSYAPKHYLEIIGKTATVNGVVDGVPISISSLLTKDSTHSNSTVFNFASDIVNGVVQRTLADDVAPMRLDGTTIGANHGYFKTNLTVAAHGKTSADIGSVWTNGYVQYVIVEIVSTEVISVTARLDNSNANTGVYAHVSGAANTANFTATAVTGAGTQQWYPAIRDRKLNIFVDDLKIDGAVDGKYNFEKNVKFLESYSIMKKSDIVEWLITNKGQNHVNYNAVPAYTVNFGYTFDHECGCTIYFGGVGRKTVDLIDQMITQSIQLAQGNGTVYNYIPKAVEFTEGGFTYNFSKLENLYSKNPSTPLYLTAGRQEVGTNPIDRIVMLNDQVGYATGYLPILDAAPDVRVSNASNKYLEIRNGSLKLYPRLIDSASINKISKGDTFEAIAYRVYFLRDPNCTAKYTVRSNYGDFFFLHWHTFGEHEVELPADLVGREFEIVEQSSNVDLISNFASHSIIVDVTNTRVDGYLVLKFT